MAVLLAEIRCGFADLRAAAFDCSPGCDLNLRTWLAEVVAPTGGAAFWSPPGLKGDHSRLP